MYPQYTNPVNDFYFRNSQNYGQPVMFPPQTQPQVNSRFVTNIEEAKAAMIDPLSHNLFLDTSTGKIYLKKLSNSGQSEFLCYSVEEPKEEKKIDPIQEINARLSNIENFLGGLRNDKSVSDVQQSAGDVTTDATEQNEPNAETESSGLSKNARNDKWKK